jgi:hypothetical protein
VEAVTESRMFAFEDLQVWQKAVDFAEIGWISEEKLKEIKSAGEEITKMLNSLIKTIKSNIS